MFDKKPQIDLNQIRPTSKLSLKLSCLAACENDVDKAERLYRFIADDMKQLPEVDVVPPTALEQFKTGANDLFGWLGEHRDSLIEGWNFIQALRGGTPISAASAAPPAGVPPVPKP